LADSVLAASDGGKEENFIPTAALLEKCAKIDELVWIETGHKLAGFLRQFDLSPTQDATGNCRGYVIRREWVDEWQERYQAFEDSVLALSA
jgi:hypothetical protein